MEGYKHMFNDTLVTVWSAPNYCYRCGNVASVLSLEENGEREVKLFDEVESARKGADGDAGALAPYFL